MTRLKTLVQVHERCDQLERTAVRAALGRHDWSLAGAARELDVAPTSLREIIARLGLQPEYGQRNPGRGRPRVTTCAKVMPDGK